MADEAAVQAELQALGGLAAGLEHHGVAVGVAAERLGRRVTRLGAALGAAVAAAGAEVVQAGGARLQKTQQHHGALAREAGQQQAQEGGFGKE